MSSTLAPCTLSGFTCQVQWFRSRYWLKAVLDLIVANLRILSLRRVVHLMSSLWNFLCLSPTLKLRSSLYCNPVLVDGAGFWSGLDILSSWRMRQLVSHPSFWHCFPPPRPCVCQGMAARDCLLWSLPGSVWFCKLPEPQTGRGIKSKHAGKYLNEYLLIKHLSPPEVLALPPNSARPQGHGYLIFPQTFTCLCPWKCCLSSLILMIFFFPQRWLFRSLIHSYGQSVVFLIFRSSSELWTLDTENI